MKVQLGGGLRTRAAVERALGFGVSRVVIGTRAAESTAFVGELRPGVRRKNRRGDRDAKTDWLRSKAGCDTTGTGALALARQMDGLGVAHPDFIRTLARTEC